MRRIIDRRTVLWGVAAIVLAAAFLLAMTAIGDAASEQPTIDTAAPIDPTQCAPCHLDLGAVQEPGLVFSHGNHLLVSCDGCHARMPHRDGNTEKVPMEVCFACHGVQHGPQGELASSKCRDCHTKSFELRPKSHTSDWKKKPHADSANSGGVNSCMMCHDAPKDCDECHKAQGVDVPKMPDVYHPMVAERPKGPSIKIYPKGPVSMSQCVYCHPDLDAITPGRLVFAHAAHLQRNYSCTACHAEFPHKGSKVQKPDMQSCYRCHGVYHNGQGLVAEGQDCYKCHPKSFELMPDNHTKKFITQTHGKMSNADPAYCAMCHASDFCVGCHRGEDVSPNAPGHPVIPANHRKSEWQKAHGGQFLSGEGACGSCHDDASCKRCHKTVMPHPVGWMKNHKPEPGTTAADCNICHQDRNSCQKCHHQNVEKGELIAKNCTPCHDEMKASDPTKITNKGFAEHAVHFNVHKVSKGGGTPKDEPYTCDDCHIGYTTVTRGGNVEVYGSLPSAGHDVRLCYGCHGSVDYQNRIIAPWSGAELCLRCHSDLNI